MMRLTLRSGKDARFLARIVDAGGGHPFVLDFGDRRIIDDVQQRLLHGFTMWRFGELISATPTETEMLQNLAEYYAGEGLLVALEEPTWNGRDATLDERIPVPAVDRELFGVPDSADGDLTERDDATELAHGDEERGDTADTADTSDTTESADLDEMNDVGPYLQDETDPSMRMPVPAAFRRKGGVRVIFSVPESSGPGDDGPPPPVNADDAIEDQQTEMIEDPKTEIDHRKG